MINVNIIVFSYVPEVGCNNLNITVSKLNPFFFLRYAQAVKSAILVVSRTPYLVSTNLTLNAQIIFFVWNTLILNIIILTCA